MKAGGFQETDSRLRSDIEQDAAAIRHEMARHELAAIYIHAIIADNAESPRSFLPLPTRRSAALAYFCYQLMPLSSLISPGGAADECYML